MGSLGSRTTPPLKRFVEQRRALREGLGKADIVVCHYPPSLFPALDLLGDRPLVCHYHGPQAGIRRIERQRGFWVTMGRTMESMVVRRSVRFITLSNAFREILIAEHGVGEDRVHVIPGGVDLTRFDRAADRGSVRRRLGVPEDCTLMVSVRRLVDRMGLDRLIDAVAAVVRDHPSVVLLIGGTGPLAAQLEAQVRRLGLHDHVRLLGPVGEDELPLLYAAADLSVVPTRAFEGFGLVLLESLACGTPALGTPVGGMPEVLRPLSHDLVLPGSSVADLARGMCEVLDGRRRLPGAEECRAYVAGRYSWTNVADRVMDVYEGALRARTKQSGAETPDGDP
jgi:glycosyltransferase involved in cell wall biosynthesis